MIDRTGLLTFIAARIAEDRADAAELPERWRSLFERHYALLETQLAGHEPHDHWTSYGERECAGCLDDIGWPCDFTLRTAALWAEHKDYRPEWGDALGAHPVGQGH